MRVCGPKFSICCAIISVWGIIMLVLMGIFLYTHSVAFAEDMPEPSEESDFTPSINNWYRSTALNCWIAACLYIVSLAASVHQYFMNRRANYSI